MGVWDSVKKAFSGKPPAKPIADIEPPEDASYMQQPLGERIESEPQIGSIMPMPRGDKPIADLVSIEEEVRLKSEKPVTAVVESQIPEPITKETESYTRPKIYEENIQKTGSPEFSLNPYPDTKEVTGITKTSSIIDSVATKTQDFDDAIGISSIKKTSDLIDTSEKKISKEEQKTEIVKEEPKPVSSAPAEPSKTPVATTNGIQKNGEKSWLERKLETGWQSLTGSLSEREYARKGGYYGKDVTVLTDEITKYEGDNSQYKNEIDQIDTELRVLEDDKFQLESQKSRSKEDNQKLEAVKRSIASKRAYKEELKQRINKNETAITKRETEIKSYHESVERGKRAYASTDESTTTRSKIKRELRNIGEGAADIKPFGVRQKDWFGKEGFLSHPQIKGTSGVIEPVRTRSSVLGSYTRATGTSVQGGLASALTKVQAGRILSPMGVPGTIAGAKQQFEYNIPARTIPLSQVNKANINRDILPNIFETKMPEIPQPQVEQYQQSTTPDGSVMMVPIQQRGVRLTPVLSRKYKMPKPAVVKMPQAVKKTSVIHGIGNIGSVKSDGILDFSDIKTPKSVKQVTVSKPQATSDLGLLSVGKMKMFASDKKEDVTVPKVRERRPRKISALVDIDSSKQITKNIKNIISKKK